ncbi:hypothetical protein K466DRAFT_607383 [Polyporus arcularius HHB13444]|uniref:Uncharacterized protein n=1 Tax=Polyporus arcularius HHB13444 TaxID=1314778 RepID=A0A5C3NM13_9APHY|nr:hypothetical protein K466DRAFT_607383 [Polyporus arcularius HHB13444]
MNCADAPLSHTPVMSSSPHAFETSRWTLCTLFPVDMITWGPAKGNLHACKDTRLSLVVCDNESVSLCVVSLCLTGEAKDNIVVLELNKLEAFTERLRVSDHTVMFHRGNAGLGFTFAHRSAADDFMRGAKVSSSTYSDQTPSLDNLRQLGVIGEEDITLGYEQSFVGDQPLQPCDFLFQFGPFAMPEDGQDLVHIDSFPRPAELTWKSDSEEWLETEDMSDYASHDIFDSSDSETESEVFYDAVESLECISSEL